MSAASAIACPDPASGEYRRGYAGIGDVSDRIGRPPRPLRSSTCSAASPAGSLAPRAWPPSGVNAPRTRLDAPTRRVIGTRAFVTARITSHRPARRRRNAHEHGLVVVCDHKPRRRHDAGGRRQGRANSSGAERPIAYPSRVPGRIAVASRRGGTARERIRFRAGTNMTLDPRKQHRLIMIEEERGVDGVLVRTSAGLLARRHPRCLRPDDRIEARSIVVGAGRFRRGAALQPVR